MSGLIEHAERELDLLYPENSPVGDPAFTSSDRVKSDLLELVALLDTQNHSKSSGRHTLELLSKLLNFENLSPLTDNPDEWDEVKEGLWQNRRYPRAFSKDRGCTYQLNIDYGGMLRRSERWTA